MLDELRRERSLPGRVGVCHVIRSPFRLFLCLWGVDETTHQQELLDSLLIPAWKIKIGF